ncbi:hypothetical protein [Marinicella sp. W31]|uniref:hypothetical protein n=1 Tax=Marinicella sp. W31 TaxID=3023713 RepID=UPI003756C492
MQEENKSTIEFSKPPFSQGGVWLMRSFELFSQRPAFWNSLVIVLFFAFFLINAIFGAFAPIVIFLLVPFTSSLAIFAAEHLDQKITEPMAQHIQLGIKKHQQTLLAYGFVCMGFAFILGFIEQFALAAIGIDMTQYSMQNLPPLPIRFKAMAIGLLIFLPLYLAMFFGCTLILFQGLRPLKALEVSLTTSIACWRPVLGYSLLLLTLVAVPLILFSWASNLASGAEAIQSLLSLLGMIAFIIFLLIITAVNMIMAYVAYCDVFGPTIKQDDPNDNDDQVLSEF